MKSQYKWRGRISGLVALFFGVRKIRPSVVLSEEPRINRGSKSKDPEDVSTAMLHQGVRTKMSW